MRRARTMGWMVAAVVGISGCGSDGTEPRAADDEWTASLGGSSGVGGSGVGGSADGPDDRSTWESAGGSAPDGGLFFDSLGTWSPDTTVAGAACQEEMQDPEPYKVVLMLVVDVSGSMTQPVAGTTLTKWDVTREALGAVVNGLPPEVAMGAVYFPNLDPMPVPHESPIEDLSECVNTGALVEPKVLDHRQRDRLEASLDDVVVAGGTPTHSAYQVGLDVLTGANLPGNKYLLLITDGEPTYGAGCLGNGTTLRTNIQPEYITDTLGLIEGAAKPVPPIGTFVIGSPGSELLYSGADARPWLSQAARLGRTAPIGCSDDGPGFCHFDLTDLATNFSAGLNNALAQILGQVVACDFYPPSPSGGAELDLSRVDVKMVDGAGKELNVPRTSLGACDLGSHGWYLTADESMVRLCPRTCTTLRQDAAAGISVYYGCRTPIL